MLAKFSPEQPRVRSGHVFCKFPDFLQVLMNLLQASHSTATAHSPLSPPNSPQAVVACRTTTRSGVFWGFRGAQRRPNRVSRVRSRRPALRCRLRRLHVPPYFPCCSRACTVASAAAPGHEPMTPIHPIYYEQSLSSGYGRPTSRAVPVAAGRVAIAIAARAG